MYLFLLIKDVYIFTKLLILYLLSYINSIIFLLVETWMTIETGNRTQTSYIHYATGYLPDISH
jgi:hypothetical protein